jgi:hypothetical protein
MTIPRIDGLDRNYLMNGAFDYFQRGVDILTVAGVPAYYAPDRWFINTANQQFTLKKSTDTPANSKSRFSLEYNTVSAIGGTDRIMATTQRIESVFARELSNKPVSLRFDYKSFSANQVQIVISKPVSIDDFSSSTLIYDETFSIDNSDTWGVFKLENLALPDVSTGLNIEILYKNTVLLVGNNGHKIADIKLSVGTKVQEFSLAGRDAIEELQLCQRYYEKSYNLDDMPTTITSVSAKHMMSNSGGMFQHTFSFKVTKRGNPVCSLYSPITGIIGNIYRSTAGDIAQTTTLEGVSAFSIDRTSGIATNRRVTAHWTADAEL